MPNIDKFFPSKYLRPADIDGVRAVTIQSVEVISLNGQTKLLCQFQELPKGLILNVGNSRKIADLVGSPDTDHWVGHRVALKVQATTFQGSTVDGIRVVLPPARSAKPSPRPAAAADRERGDDESSDVGF